MGKDYMGIALDSQPMCIVSISQCPCQSEFDNTTWDTEHKKYNIKITKVKERMMHKNRLPQSSRVPQLVKALSLDLG